LCRLNACPGSARQHVNMAVLTILPPTSSPSASACHPPGTSNGQEAHARICRAGLWRNESASPRSASVKHVPVTPIEECSPAWRAAPARATLIHFLQIHACEIARRSQQCVSVTERASLHTTSIRTVIGQLATSARVPSLHDSTPSTTCLCPQRIQCPEGAEVISE